MKTILFLFAFFYSFVGFSQKDTLSMTTMIDTLAKTLIEGGWINEETYVEQTSILFEFSDNLSAVLINHPNLREAMGTLKIEVYDKLDGTDVKTIDIKRITNLVNPLLIDINNRKYSDDQAIELIKNKALEVKMLDAPKITMDEKTAVLLTGNFNISPEQKEQFLDIALISCLS